MTYINSARTGVKTVHFHTRLNATQSQRIFKGFVDNKLVFRADNEVGESNWECNTNPNTLWILNSLESVIEFWTSEFVIPILEKQSSDISEIFDAT